MQFCIPLLQYSALLVWQGIHPFLIHVVVRQASHPTAATENTPMRDGAFLERLGETPKGHDVSHLKAAVVEHLSGRNSGHDERASRDVLWVVVDRRFADGRVPTRSSRRVFIMRLSKVKSHPNWPLFSVSSQGRRNE